MTRQQLIDAITAMLEEADFRALRLIWIAARRLTAKPVTECPLDATPCTGDCPDSTCQHHL